MKSMLLVLSLLALANVSIAQHCTTQTIGTQTFTRLSGRHPDHRPADRGDDLSRRALIPTS
jgi:hypothetical protein